MQAYPEDEHQLIAAYANQLANTPETNTNFGGKFEMGEFSASLAGNMDAMSSHSKHLVRELERKNREIMRDIHQLKHAHRNRSQRLMQMPTGGMGPADPSIVSELEVCILYVCSVGHGHRHNRALALGHAQFLEGFLADIGPI